MAIRLPITVAGSGDNQLNPLARSVVILQCHMNHYKMDINKGVVIRVITVIKN